ncbi:MAG: pirin family protein [Desulfobulbaceae bacterium]|nr:pirin family protein [Candidatus Kapabacteria bacterium]MBS3999480.1 pirin family protein [Desulfobulbaceae bacterium]
MEKIIHRAEDRGFANHGWLEAAHSFSFASYHDPSKVRFGLLRVLNDDIVHPGKGFGTHPHDNMEIITIPMKGALAHKDSMGNASVIRENEVQVMSAGSGIMHSEYNHSDEDKINLLQIWIFPNQRDVEPRYQQKVFSPDERINKFQEIVSPNPDGTGVWIYQNAWLNLVTLTHNNELTYKMNDNANGLYIFNIEGKTLVADETLNRRDAIALTNLEEIKLNSDGGSELLLLEVPMRQM